jgi:hypothetical protein
MKKYMDCMVRKETLVYDLLNDHKIDIYKRLGCFMTILKNNEYKENVPTVEIVIFLNCIFIKQIFDSII